MAFSYWFLFKLVLEAARAQSNLKLKDGFISPRSNAEVQLGEHDIWEPDGTEQHIMSAKFIRHPDYNSRIQDSGIMLIKLSRPAALNSYVRPAKLPSKCASDGTMCQISGWGTLRPSDEGCELHTVWLCENAPFHVILVHKNIYAYFPARYPHKLQCLDAPLLSDDTPFQITDNMICAGYLEGGKDSCQVIMTSWIVSWPHDMWDAPVKITLSFVSSGWFRGSLDVQWRTPGSCVLGAWMCSTQKFAITSPGLRTLWCLAEQQINYSQVYDIMCCMCVVYTGLWVCWQKVSKNITF